MNDPIRTIHFFPGINPSPGSLDLGLTSMPSLEKDRAEWRNNLNPASSHPSAAPRITLYVPQTRFYVH